MRSSRRSADRLDLFRQFHGEDLVIRLPEAEGATGDESLVPSSFGCGYREQHMEPLSGTVTITVHRERGNCNES
jgi:hypothetical protein